MTFDEGIQCRSTRIELFYFCDNFRRIALWGSASCRHVEYEESYPTHSIVVIWVNIFKTGKTIEIQLVRQTEVCGKVLSEKYVSKSVKTALLLSNVIDADHQNSCLFTNEGHLSSPLCV